MHFFICRGRCRRDHMLVAFTTTYTISAYHHNIVSSNPSHGKVYSIQHYVIKFVSDLRQVSGFLLVLSTNKTDHHNITEILYKLALNTMTLTLSFVVQM